MGKLIAFFAEENYTYGIVAVSIFLSVVGKMYEWITRAHGPDRVIDLGHVLDDVRYSLQLLWLLVFYIPVLILLALICVLAFFLDLAIFAWCWLKKFGWSLLCALVGVFLNTAFLLQVFRGFPNVYFKLGMPVGLAFGEVGLGLIVFAQAPKILSKDPAKRGPAFGWFAVSGVFLACLFVLDYSYSSKYMIDAMDLGGLDPTLTKFAPFITLLIPTVASLLSQYTRNDKVDVTLTFSCAGWAATHVKSWWRTLAAKTPDFSRGFVFVFTILLGLFLFPYLLISLVEVFFRSGKDGVTKWFGIDPQPPKGPDSPQTPEESDSLQMQKESDSPQVSKEEQQ